MSIISDLINYLKEQNHPVWVQTHDFPDHDAVASAYGVQYLLSQFGINSRLTYQGSIERVSLSRIINELNIDIRPIKETDMKSEDLIIIVDGCKGNKNVTDLIGKEIAVIDHHRVAQPEDVPFVDLRNDYGSCSTIVYSYYHELNVTISRQVATALMIGIDIDTKLLTRGVHQADIMSYYELFPVADMDYVNTVVLNNIEINDLQYFHYALENKRIFKRMVFCYFKEGCPQNLLGILSDFFLGLKEIDFVILCAHNGDRVNFSLRSEDPNWDCSVIIRKILKGIGYGGGHHHMAGGILTDLSQFDAQLILDRTLKLLYD